MIAFYDLFLIYQFEMKSVEELRREAADAEAKKAARKQQLANMRTGQVSVRLWRDTVLLSWTPERSTAPQHLVTILTLISLLISFS